MCRLYSMPNLLVIHHLDTLYLGGNSVRVVCERVWRIDQVCAIKRLLATGTRDWIANDDSQESSTRVKHARSWSRKDPGWWRMKSCLDQPRLAWSGCNKKIRPWSSATGVLLSNPLRCQFMEVGSYPWGMPCLSLWSPRTSSTSYWPFWPSQRWPASRGSVLLV